MGYEINREKHKPLYEQIYEQLKYDILSGKYKAGHQLPPEIEFSSELGVSRNTVRQAIMSLAREGLVTRAKGRGSFVTQKAHAKSKAIRKHRVSSGQYILVVQPRFRIDHILHPFYCSAISEIETVLAVEGYELAYATVDSNTPIEDMVKRVNARGIIMAGVSDREVALRLCQCGIPVVSAHEVFPGLPISCVSIDNVIGGYLAASYLIENGHQRLAFILNSSYDKVFIDRHRGYAMALEHYKIDYCAHIVKTGEPYEREAYEAMKELISKGAEIDSVVASSDVVALGVMDALFESGFTVPHDVSVIGYDDLSIAHMTYPRLTTIRQPAEEVGRRTAERTLELIYGEDNAAKHILVEPVLVERQSCRRVHKVAQTTV